MAVPHIRWLDQVRLNLAVQGLLLFQPVAAEIRQNACQVRALGLLSVESEEASGPDVSTVACLVLVGMRPGCDYQHEQVLHFANDVTLRALDRRDVPRFLLEL